MLLNDIHEESGRIIRCEPNRLHEIVEVAASDEGDKVYARSISESSELRRQRMLVNDREDGLRILYTYLSLNTARCSHRVLCNTSIVLSRRCCSEFAEFS